MIDELGDLLNVPKTKSGRLWFRTSGGLWIIAGDVRLRKASKDPSGVQHPATYASFGHWKGCANMIPELKGVDDPDEAYQICLRYAKERAR
jgi:hypothetical protein